MAGFLYYRGGDDSPLGQGAATLDLDYALDGPVEERQCSAGPDGTRGLLFAVDARQGGRAVGYHADRQTWRKLPGRDGKVWVGFWNDAKPTPSDLLRAKTLPGLGVQMADGHHWQIPVVRKFDESAKAWRSKLPAHLDYDDAGRIIVGDPLPQYATLWDATTPIADAKLDDASDSDAEAVYRAAVALLQTNYVVDLPELVAIHALANDESLALAVLASCRYDDLKRWLDDSQKKTFDPSIPRGETTSAGAAV